VLHRSRLVCVWMLTEQTLNVTQSRLFTECCIYYIIYCLIYCIYINILYQYYCYVLWKTVRMCRHSADPDTTYDHASKTTVEGHVVGLLDRDQRTALTRRKFDDMRAVLVSQPPSHPCSCSRTMHWRHPESQVSRAKCQPKSCYEIKWHLRRTIHSK